jgi:phenylalanyl-tRNA synthetase beta chain
MKLSLRWICDHLKIDWKKVDVACLVEKFNTTVAEIEEYEQYQLNLSSFALAQVVSIEKSEVKCPEFNLYETLSQRDDLEVGSWYLIKRYGKKTRWALASDFGYPKEKFLPAFACTEKEAQSGSWKKLVEIDDFILDVDNKSITHRPDLWSHRGFAREVAGLLNTTLVSEQKLLRDIPLATAKQSFKATKEIPLSVSIESPECKRFAALYLDEVSHQVSLLWMAFRLLRLESRPIDFFVDVTNYVMLDMGQPLHAFDAEKITTKTLVSRNAKKGETLELLDGTTVDLTKDDLVITDSKKPVALAGIKGGSKSGISRKTKSIILESANFNAATIRLTAARNKIRTEASARFEKSLDPNQNIVGIMRFVQLLEDADIDVTYTPKIISLGAVVKSPVIKIAHTFIEKRLGTSIKQSFIKKTLETIGFKVKETSGVYLVTVPTYRSTKDISIPEDIVEEVGRYLGYTTIPEQLPHIVAPVEQSKDFQVIDRIKETLAFCSDMHEVQNYGFADNIFLKKINWKKNNPVILSNPLSEDRTDLVTCLIPGLLQNIHENMADKEELRFFEWGRVWRVNKKTVNEHHILAGIFFKRKGEVDFYEAKEHIDSLLNIFDIKVEWKKSIDPQQWASRYQTANLYYKGKNIGTAGKVKRSKMAALGQGDAFAFEFCGDFLKSYQPAKKKFVELPKYQDTFLDISIMVALPVTVGELEKAIKSADSRIFAVNLKDVYTQEDWDNKKSVTLRFFVQDKDKTLNKKEIEAINMSVQKALKPYGGAR